MGTISGNLYKIGYVIETLAANVNDPPTAVSALTFALVNAASLTAAITALSTDLSISGTQRLGIQFAQQVHGGLTIYN